MKKEIVVSRTEQFEELMKRIESETCILWSSGAKPTCSGIIDVGKFPLTISINGNGLEWTTMGLNNADTTIDRFVKMLKIEKVVTISYKSKDVVGTFETMKDALEAIEDGEFAKFALNARFSTIVRQSNNPDLALAIWLRKNKDEVMKFLGGE